MTVLAVVAYSPFYNEGNEGNEGNDSGGEHGSRSRSKKKAGGGRPGLVPTYSVLQNLGQCFKCNQTL